MATKTITPLNSHITQISSNFSKSGGYWQGTADFRCSDGYKFKNLNTAVSNPTGYKIIVTRANGTTFNIASANYCNFKLIAYSDPDLTTRTMRFTLLTGAQIEDTNFNLVWNLDALLEQTANPPITLTENLTQCTLSGTPSEITATTVLNLTTTSANGYKFTSAPTLTITDQNGNDTTVNFVISQNELTATVSCDLSNYANVANLTVTAAAVLIPSVSVNITQNLTNCITNAPLSISNTDTVLNITATANNNYEFTTTPTIKFYDTNGDLYIDEQGNPAYYNFTTTQNKLTATINLTLTNLINVSKIGNIILSATANAVQIPTIPITQNLTNCVLSGLPQNVYSDTVLNLTITANQNCIFENAPYLYLLVDGNPVVENFTLSNNDTIATINFDLSEITGNIDNITIAADATVITPYTDKYGSINIYKVTPQNLNAFATQRFFIENISQGTDTPNYEKIDLGVYVNTIKRLYINVGETVSNVLKCGNYNTNIAVQTPLNDNIEIDCGAVTIPTPNTDITDYNSEINIFLPFIGFQNIPSDYIGKTINLQYICNIVTANAVAKLICDNVVFACYECDLSSDIIFKTSEKSTEIKGLGNLDFNMNVLKGLQPYINIKYFNSQNNKIYNSDNIRTVLNTLVGFNSVTEFTNFNNNFITLKEFEILQSELEKGVFFTI